MNQIAVGTCIPGNSFFNWAPPLAGKGFECFTVNFHMTLKDANLREMAPRVKAFSEEKNVKISALGFYCNALEQQSHFDTLCECIDAARDFGTDTVSTFAGAYEGKSVDEAMPRFKEVFGELARRAEDRGVRIAIENCPMGGTWKNNTCNIGFNPRAWDMMFDAVPSDALGLEWEPAHQIAQLIDPIANLRRYAGKVFHVHGKDATVNRDVLASEGFMGRNHAIISRFPGLGDTDWRQIFTILQMAGYKGCVSIEGYHDPLFSGDWECTGQMHALSYLKWCRGGEFAPNFWNK